MVDPCLLLARLQNNGSTNNPISLLGNFFTDRKQQVKLNDVKSDFASIQMGVPQGSVLGSFLFLVFIVSSFVLLYYVIVS